MTANYHTALTAADAANAETYNAVLQQLDQQMTDMDDGTHSFSAIDINGGALDGATIGGTTPAAGAFTTLSVNGSLNFGSTFKVGIQYAQYVAATTLEVVKWNLNFLDSDSALDLSTGVYTFTPAVAGYYFLVAAVNWTAGAAGKIHSLSIYKNGAVAATSTNDSKGTHPETVTVGTLLQANGTSDYFDVRAYNGSAGTVLISTDTGESFFSGTRVF